MSFLCYKLSQHLLTSLRITVWLLNFIYTFYLAHSAATMPSIFQPQELFTYFFPQSGRFFSQLSTWLTLSFHSSLLLYLSRKAFPSILSKTSPPHYFQYTYTIFLHSVLPDMYLYVNLFITCLISLEWKLHGSINFFLLW